MRSSLRPLRGVLLIAAFALASCRNDSAEPMPAPPVTGTVVVAGLSAPVRIVRDRWGVPHVFADSRDDVFVAQGFVQAQDRLFQMDLWRRAAQGRLSEVLGANFIERDAMTRRLQYHGDLDAEWASYGPDAKTIAGAFVRGVNAWTAIARQNPPEMFRLAGWLPDSWNATDLLNRTDVFDRQASIDAAVRAGLPGAVVDAVRRAAVPPFFTGLAARVRVSADAPVPLSADAVPLPSPSTQYLIHLHTPNWSAIGATAPWRPGIAIGHDGFATWSRRFVAAAAQVRSEPLGAGIVATMKDAIGVKGREEAFAFETQVTARGVVIATDRAGNRQFTLEWDGFRAGAAPAFTERRAIDATNPIDSRDRLDPVRVLFAHPLAITDNARRRFNISVVHVGPVEPFFVTWDSKAWDASRAMNAPGQSEWPDSRHYADLAALWSRGESFTLVFSEPGVTANAESTLTLVPDRRR